MIAAWRPFSANATSYGLVMLSAYATAVWWCCIAANQCRHTSLRHGDARIDAQQRDSRLWQAMAALLAGLAIYRQLDVAELLTGLGRIVASRGEWYAQRRPFQLAMVGVIVTSVVGLAAVLFRAISAADPRVSAALAGCTVLILLLAVDAVSLHVIDRFLRSGYHGVNVYNMVEAGSLVTILAESRGYRKHMAQDYGDT